MKKKVGIVGFGKLGNYLVDKILNKPELNETTELAFVWNRDTKKIPSHLPILQELSDFKSKEADIIVEVAHPNITREFGSAFLESADYMCGSPTALGEEAIRAPLLQQAQKGPYGLYIPKGAMIGLDDIIAARKTGRVKELTLTMEKTPDSIRYAGPKLPKDLDDITERTTVYDGPLGPLCQYAPNNVNTMAVATLASGIEFDKVRAILTVDPSLNIHKVAISLKGPEEEGARFSLDFVKENPAKKGAVTGQATYDSFVFSLMAAGGRGSGIHFC